MPLRNYKPYCLYFQVYSLVNALIGLIVVGKSTEK